MAYTVMAYIVMASARRALKFCRPPSILLRGVRVPDHASGCEESPLAHWVPVQSYGLYGYGRYSDGLYSRG